jgi:hypothetical protein
MTYRIVCRLKSTASAGFFDGCEYFPLITGSGSSGVYLKSAKEPGLPPPATKGLHATGEMAVLPVAPVASQSGDDNAMCAWNTPRCYTPDMTIQEIQRLRSAKPFEPFTVLTADGQKYNVAHPEYISQTPSGRRITIGLPDDSMVTLDLLLVTGIRKPLPKRKRA